MKLKKFFAGVLAAAMMLTVGATAAFADEPTADTTAPAQETITKLDGTSVADTTTPVSIYKKYEVKNGSAPSETFEFTIAYNTMSDAEKEATDPSVNIPNGKKTIAFEGPLATGEHVGHFTLTLSELGLVNPKVGKYVYTITENAGSTPAVSYDTSTLYLVVSVVHETDSTTHEIKKGYKYSVSLHKGTVNGEKTDAYFVNTYGADNSLKNLSLSKTVRGSFGDLNEDFTFQVKFYNKENKNYAGAVVSNGEGTYSIKDASNQPVAKGAVLAFDTPYTVTLRHHSSISFDNLPAGITYEISENGSDWHTVNGATVAMKDQYNVSLENNGELTSNEANKPAAQGTIGTDKNASVGFINDHQGQPDMGVVLDNAPYIAMLAIVAIGGVALMLNKRRRDEE